MPFELSFALDAPLNFFRRFLPFELTGLSGLGCGPRSCCEGSALLPKTLPALSVLVTEIVILRNEIDFTVPAVQVIVNLVKTDI